MHGLEPTCYEILSFWVTWMELDSMWSSIEILHQSLIIFAIVTSNTSPLKFSPPSWEVSRIFNVLSFYNRQKKGRFGLGLNTVDVQPGLGNTYGNGWHRSAAAATAAAAAAAAATATATAAAAAACDKRPHAYGGHKSATAYQAAHAASPTATKSTFLDVTSRLHHATWVFVSQSTDNFAQSIRLLIFCLFICSRYVGTDGSTDAAWSDAERAYWRTAA